MNSNITKKNNSKNTNPKPDIYHTHTSDNFKAKVVVVERVGEANNIGFLFSEECAYCETPNAQHKGVDFGNQNLLFCNQDCEDKLNKIAVGGGVVC